MPCTAAPAISGHEPNQWLDSGPTPLSAPLRPPPRQLAGTGVRVSVGYPPDTDTPGHGVENETKPRICWEVNDALGSELFPVEKVRLGWLALLGAGAPAWHLSFGAQHTAVRLF